jgi:hypothetical protein
VIEKEISLGKLCGHNPWFKMNWKMRASIVLSADHKAGHLVTETETLTGLSPKLKILLM